MMVFKKNILFVSLLFLILTGCNKKWKKTADVNLGFEIATTNSSLESISVSSGTIKLEKFTFSGIREKGANVNFEDVFSDGRTVDCISSSLSEDILYKIPQGKYTSISTILSINSSDSTIIEIHGLFLDSIGEYEKFIFYLNDAVEISISNHNLIEIIANHDGNFVISLDVANWFASIPDTLMEEANTVNIDGTDIILIDKSNNELIYALIVSRIGQNSSIKYN